MGTLHNDHFTFTIAQFFSKWETFQTKSVDKRKEHILYIQ